MSLKTGVLTGTQGEEQTLNLSSSVVPAIAEFFERYGWLLVFGSILIYYLSKQYVKRQTHSFVYDKERMERLNAERLRHRAELQKQYDENRTKRIEEDKLNQRRLAEALAELNRSSATEFFNE